MKKLGLQAPPVNAPLVDSLIGNMHKDGVKTAGTSFLNAPNMTIKNPAKIGDIAPSFANIQTSVRGTNVSFRDKLVGPAQAVSDFTVNAVKPGLKNMWGIVSSPFVGLPKVGFAITHGGQMEDAYYYDKYRKQIDEVNVQWAAIEKGLTDGTLTKTEYDKAISNLGSWSGDAIDTAHARWKQADLVTNGYRDWQTGNYKEHVGIGDVYNIIDGAISVYTLGTAGMGKGVIMNSAKEGIFKTGGNFVVESIGTVIGPKAAGLIDDVVSKVVTKIPGLNEYADRQILKLGGDVTAGAFFKATMAEVIINSPMRRMNMDSAVTIVDSVMNDKFFQTPEGQHWINSGAAQSILLAGMALKGGPIGFITHYLGKAGSGVKVAMFGDESVSYLNKLSRLSNDDAVKLISEFADGTQGSKLDHFFRILSGDANDARLGYQYLVAHPDKMAQFKSVYATWLGSGKLDNIWQDAAAAILKDLSAGGKALNIENAMDHMFRWQQVAQIGDDATKALINAGKLRVGQQAAVVTFSREAQVAVRKDITDIVKDIAEKAKLSGDVPKEVVLKAQKDAALRYLSDHQAKGTAWAQHDGLVKDMVDAISDAKTAFSGKKGLGDSIVNAIKVKETATIVSGVPRKITKQLSELGYYLAIPKNVGNPFVSVADAATTRLETTLISAPKNGLGKALGLSKPSRMEDLAAVLGDDIAAVRGADPTFGAIGAMLNKAGLGLGDAHKEAYKLITTNMAEGINTADVGVDGINAISKLQMYADKSRTITDLRGMTQNEIMKALNLTDKSAAKMVQQAIVNAHITVPIEIRGMGDRIVDYAMKINPLQGLYQRTQGALRYSYNPFFRVQESAETKLLGLMTTNGDNAFLSTFGRMNPQNTQYLDEVTTKMRQYGILEGTMFGEAATTGVVGRVSAKIGTMQQRDLASVVDSMAGKMGMSVDDLLTHHANDVIDAVRPIVQYPKNGVLNSNFMRTLNLVAFPARYNIKVSAMTLNALARQTPVVQVAVTKGLLNFGNWLNTDEGLAWRQDYSKEIAFIKWLTPLGNLDWAFRTLQGKNNSYSEFGMLGGLPLGVITQMLESQGVIDNQAPFIDPKSGVAYASKIPISVQGRLASALMDLLGSTFTYPGRTLLLPGKTAALRDVAYRVTGSSGQDFETRQPDLSRLQPEQQRAQKFWYDRANPDQTLPALTPNTPPVNINEIAPLPTPGRHTKVDIRNAKKSTAKGKKTKQPVPFAQVVGR